MAFKLNNSVHYEPLMVTLSESTTPIAWKAKVEELIEECGCSREEAEELASQPIEVEMYYEKGTGLFLVQTDAVEAGTVYSPYTQELGEDADEE